MSNDVLLGTVPDADGDGVEVWRNADQTVSLISLREDEPALTFAPGGLDAVRELLGRAAMPGVTTEPPGQPGHSTGGHMTPTIGRIVHYTLTAQDAEAINRRRGDFAAFNRANRDAASEQGEFPGRSGHVGHYGNPASEGQAYPAVVTAAWGGPSANLKVLLDGNDDYWATSRSEGDGPGYWSWPPRA